MQGTTSLRALDLEKEYKRRGVPSLAHESFAYDGTVLGSYGASVRNGLSEAAQNAQDGPMQRGCDSFSGSVVTENSVQNSKEGKSGVENKVANDVENEVENEKEEEKIKEILGKKSARRLEKAKDKHNVHISRQQLRDLLMKDIPTSNVIWGKHFSHYIDKMDSVELVFHDGSRSSASVLVAADGIYSTIRKQLIPQKEEELNSMSKGLNYLNLMVILGISPVLLGSNATVTYPTTCIPPSLISNTETEIDIETEMAITTEMSIGTDLRLQYNGSTGQEGNCLIPSKRKRSDDSVMNKNRSSAAMTCESPQMGTDYDGATGATGAAGSTGGTSPDPLPSRSQCQWLDGSTRVFTMPFDQSHTMWQLSFPCTEEEAYKLTANPILLKEKALERCRGWHEPLVTLLSATDVQLVSGHPAYDRDPLLACDLQRAPKMASETADVGGESSAEGDRRSMSKKSSSSGGRVGVGRNGGTDEGRGSDINMIRDGSDVNSELPPTSTPTPASSPVPVPPSTTTPLNAWYLGQYSRVTLLGDAAHPMSPFKAQGANQALMDAISLSEALGMSELSKVCVCGCVYVWV